jgi:hypothetical protein
MTFEIVSLILNLLLSGGLVVTFVTLRSAVKKAREEAEALRLANEDSAMKTFQVYIVDPLKKDIKSLRNEVSKFRKAVERIPDCDHAYSCPVKRQLQANEDSAGDGEINC